MFFNYHLAFEIGKLELAKLSSGEGLSIYVATNFEDAVAEADHQGSLVSNVFHAHLSPVPVNTLFLNNLAPL